jgi:acyl-CoA thioester hydrolase
MAPREQRQAARDCGLSPESEIDPDPRPGLLELTFPFILLDLYCRYLSPVRLGEVLEVGIRLSRLGGKSFDFEYLVTSRTDGRAVATGTTTQVYYNYDEGRTELVPDRLREAFARIEAEIGSS